jgi:alpha-amylase/alpha-mannosidase (GH57 family)
MTALVIHGHFYQPPRENPWTGAIDREPSAHPDHDWNERIHRECYRPNAFARVFDEYGRVERIVNNYEHISFNVGPTLLAWLEHHDPDVYERILEADRASARRRGGHGNAIAQGYNHAILPLCNDRDRRTQIRWGIADFEHRFGRRPASLWLPETACNHATLDAMIDAELRYVILSPYQADRVRKLGRPEWTDVSRGSIDPGQAYTAFHRDGSGRSIAVFFYDGPISRSLAFEGALASSQALVGRLEQGRGGPGKLVHIATDGESYGHHTPHGERGLAYAVVHEAPARGFALTNYAAFLDDHPPTMEVEIKAGPDGEGTAWSCAHGVGRWYRDCGCSSGAREGWTQAWRGPLRAALDLLRDEITARFEETRGVLFQDPWAARDDYLAFTLRTDGPKRDWLERQAGRALRLSERDAALGHLELQRSAQLMYTSCGWFFADISGIETVQILKYAQRAFDLMEELDLDPPRERFLDQLAEARSNLPEMGTGADVFRRFVDPLRVHPGRIAAHVAISSLVDDSRPTGLAAGFQFRITNHRKQRHGRLILATARIELEERATEKRYEFSVAAMHFGGVDFYCVARSFSGAHRFGAAVTRLWARFRTATLPTMLRIAQEEFGPDEYGLESLLPEGRRRVSGMVLGDIVGNFADQYARLYENNQRVLDMLQSAGLELPTELLAAAEFTFSRRFEDAVRRADGSHSPDRYALAIQIAEEAERRGFEIDRAAAGPLLAQTVVDAVTAVVTEPTVDRIRNACDLAEMMRSLGMADRLDRAQEIVDAAIPLGTDGPGPRLLRRAFGLVGGGTELAPAARATGGHA